MEKLRSVYNRDFSTGFFLGRPGPQTWTDRYGNQATHRKEHVGKVLNYYQKSKVAHVAFSRPVQIGQTLQIQGPTTGVLEFTLSHLRNKNQGDLTQITTPTDATFPCPTKVRPNDQVYRIIDLTQPNQS